MIRGHLIYCLLWLLVCCTADAGGQYNIKSFDLNPFGNSNPGGYYIYNGKLFFSAFDNVNGNEPWLTDISGNTMQMLADINPGTAASNCRNYYELNGKLFFAATDGVYGDEPRVTDGTYSGTKLLKDIQKNGNSSASAFAAMNGLLYFVAEDSISPYNNIYVTDGTDTGTRRITNNDVYRISSTLVPFNNKLYYTKQTTASGSRIYSSTGIPGDTMKSLAGIPLNGLGYVSTPWVYNNSLCFITADSISTKLWKSDGTEAGSTILKEIQQHKYAFPTSYIFNYNFNNYTFFTAFDSTYGTELWVSDGTDTGTHVLYDINPGISHTNISSPVVFKNKLYFKTSYTGNNSTIWATDGTTAGTYKAIDLGSINTNAAPSFFCIYNNSLYFIAADENDIRCLYFSDGTQAGTKKAVPPPSLGKDIPCTNIFPFDTVLAIATGFNTKNIELHFLSSTSGSYTITPTISRNNHVSTIYPNPAHHNFTIKTTEAFKQGSITITDIAGRVVKTEKLTSNTQTISLNGIAAGVYMAEVLLDDMRSVEKLVIN